MALPLIVSALLTQGLGLLGNAVLAKGKDVIEDKLGIDIESALETDEGKQQLLQLQNDHEEMLLNAALTRDKIMIEDVQSAREMNVRLNETAYSSWLNRNIAPILALVVLAGGGYTLYASPETDVRMAAVSLMTMVLGYFFGTSSSSKSKDNLIGSVIDRRTDRSAQ